MKVTALALILVISMGMVRQAGAAFVIDSLSGDITQNEINNFINTIAGRNPATNNWGNALATHGTEPEGMWRMYEATGNVTILNHYLRWMDVSLAYRNDMPLGENRVMWEGTVAPVWPNIAPGDPGEGYAGSENGMVAGYIANCARLILETPAIWNTTVPDGNPYGFGVTYYDRAITYLGEVDYVNETYLRPWFVDPSTHRFKKPTDSRWASNAGNQSVTAWNRQWLFLMGFLYSAQCHDILGDNPSYLATYKDMVEQFATWFVDAYPSGGGVYYTSGGHDVVKWYYEIPTDQHIEDIGHAQHDVFGLYECYISGYTTLAFNQVKPYADTAQYIINGGAANVWSLNVDGTGTGSDYLKSDFIYLSQWNPDLFEMIAQSNIDSNELNVDEGCKNTGSILYMKHLRYLNLSGGLTGLSVSASSSHSSYPPENTLDGDLGTRWAGNGDGTWIQYDLGQNLTIDFIKMAFYQGTSRLYYFDVQVADSASGPWTTVLSNVTSAAVNDLQTFDFPDVTGGYVRIVGHASNYDNWNNYAEVQIWGSETPVEQLVAHYTFDDGTADDSSGNGIDGTLAGTATVVNDPQRGNVLSLDGSGGKVDLGNPAGLDITGPITVAAWVRIDSAGGTIRNIVNRGHGGSPTRELTFRIDSSSNYNFGSYESGVGSKQVTSVVPGGDVGTSTWVHLAGTWDGSQWNLYRNGNLEDTLTDSAGPPAMTVGWAIGARGGVSGYERVFDGLLDDVRIYNYALTQSEIGDLVGAWISEDIGSVGQAGSATYDSQTGEFTVNGGGADIWGTADAFHYVDQILSGDGQIVARVTSVENTNSWAKAGVMIRETTDADSKHAMIVVTPSNGIAFQRRTATAGGSSNTGNSGFTVPYWVKLVRSGSTITGYRSSDGQSWVMVGSDTISMANDVLCGLAVTAHNNSTLNTSVFDNVSVSP